MNTYIYDIETYKYLFCTVFKNIETEEITVFEISDRKNEINKLLEFLKDKVGKLIGFNNINFDYPVLHWILYNYKKSLTPLDLTNAIYAKADEIINEEFSSIYKSKVLIPQIDLFKIHHFDNKAKITSLKALEIAMRLDNIQDLPYEIDKELDEKEIEEVINYCINDVEATYQFYLKSNKEIKLREDLSKEYNIDLINANDPKIGEEILLHFLSKDMKINKRELRKKRTYRNELVFNDYILPYVKFDSKGFKELLNNFKGIITESTKDAFKSHVLYKEIRFDYGQGGIHGCVKPGIYKPKDDEIIIDLDVASFYPNLAIVNNFRPEHLGESFGKIYESIFLERKKYPKSDSRNYGLKIGLNGAFGKSNDENSFLYDSAFTMKITLNGQLLLTMLIEQIGERIPCKILQANTDGFTIICKKSVEKDVNNICEEWEKLTKLQLEKFYYKKMIIRDVNNYIAIYDNDEIKLKGIFEINRAWHKNHSMLIVPKAISEYYINNIPIEETLYKAKDILDFTKRGRVNKDSKLISRKLVRLKNKDTLLYKNNRYFISNEGVELIKIMKPLENKDKLLKDPNQISIFDIVEDVKIYKPREINLESGYKCILLNEVKKRDPKKYDINYNYYINEIKKITNVIDNHV